jgi:hypothetical protein
MVGMGIRPEYIKPEHINEPKKAARGGPALAVCAGVAAATIVVVFVRLWRRR